MLLSEAEDEITAYTNGEHAANLAQSKTLSTRRCSLHGTWEISVTPSANTAGPVGKDASRTANVYVTEKSDKVVVPRKRRNNESSDSADAVEGRALAKGIGHQPSAFWTQSQGDASSGWMAVHHAARKDKRKKFTALLHHVTAELLEQSFYALQHHAAAGVDGITWQTYREDVGSRVKDLHARIHSGRYRAMPARRVYIPKADGSMRPLGILCLEDKIVQQALATVLAAIYEADFCGFSYGFRPGRSQHDALDALDVSLRRRRVNWVLDADIRGFFDAVNHAWLMRFLKHRIGDARVLRLIAKWLSAGVMNHNERLRTEQGTPQGAVISPLLANVYLHYVFDLWVDAWRKHVACGDVTVVRYADDTIVGFQHRADADRFLDGLKQRLLKFELELNTDKTRLLRFGRFAQAHQKKRGLGKPETFDFLGFTHFCTVTRSTGRFTFGRKTIKKRMRAKLQAVKAELRRRLHAPLHDTGVWIRSVLQGHLNYYAVPGNGRSLNYFFYRVSWYWLRALRRRSQRKSMNWGRSANCAHVTFPRYGFFILTQVIGLMP